MQTAREFVLANQAVVELKHRLPNDCYALRIGAHHETVVRTTVRLRGPTVGSVLAAMADDYDIHIGRLVAAARGITTAGLGWSSSRRRDASTIRACCRPGCSD